MWQTSNSRLATALLVLGYQRERISLDCSTRISNVIFTENDDLDDYERAWLHWDMWSKSNPDNPFVSLRKAADARDWIVNRVIHGTHNKDSELPERTFWTDNFKVACALIACNWYLHKLDRVARRFHFPPNASDDARLFFTAMNGTPMRFIRAYLEQFEQLNIEIKKLGIDSPRSVLQSQHQ